jgi:iron complex transport system permease protein
VIVWSGLALAVLTLPFIALELDLFAAGEDDAHGLGVNTTRVKLLALLAASLAAGVAVAVAGQIAFVGLIVPHLLRILTGASHRSLLPLCLVGGPLLLLGADFLQRSFLGGTALQPGVTMSLIGGPFFLLLLLRNRDAIRSW